LGAALGSVLLVGLAPSLVVVTSVAEFEPVAFTRPARLA